MIYILGRQNDLSTIKFIDWLIHYNIEFKRINSSLDLIDELNFELFNTDSYSN